MHRIVSFCLVLLLWGAGAASVQEAPAAVAGTWEVELTFVCGKATHTVQIDQKEAVLSGTYKGSVKEGRVRGTVNGDSVSFGTALRNDTASAPFRFSGKVQGDTMSGTVDMGEYWTATFTAKKIGK